MLTVGVLIILLLSGTGARFMNDFPPKFKIILFCSHQNAQIQITPGFCPWRPVLLLPYVKACIAIRWPGTESYKNAFPIIFESRAKNR